MNSTSNPDLQIPKRGMPVTIITRFLGSGKTTLLNQILKDREDHEHHHHSDHLANDGFVSMSYQSDRPFSVQKFQNFLDELPIEIFRAKGLLWFKESYLKHIFQLSGKHYDIQTEEWQQPKSNQLVLIGRNLNTEQLRQQLDQCLESVPSKLVAQ